ncbi:unnamed protein product [Litomosoides sigmodontis]|uniref:Uncharacterized protein n=1 Tax=Litomosoides sigmodontis TaxID=42156 RepID=A0A3P6SAN7_LITSI|nr:unnamed protein product [Litomosoides sigmodontis]
MGHNSAVKAWTHSSFVAILSLCDGTVSHLKRTAYVYCDPKKKQVRQVRHQRYLPLSVSTYLLKLIRYL